MKDGMLTRRFKPRNELQIPLGRLQVHFTTVENVRRDRDTTVMSRMLIIARVRSQGAKGVSYVTNRNAPIGGRRFF